nr:S8 family serine peptidase [Streptomyces sp. NRRL WC-3744]
MEWAARDRHARIVGMADGDGTDPMRQAVNGLSTETGALFVIATGNSGPGAHSVNSPAPRTPR